MQGIKDDVSLLNIVAAQKCYYYSTKIVICKSLMYSSTSATHWVSQIYKEFIIIDPGYISFTSLIHFKVDDTNLCPTSPS